MVLARQNYILLSFLALSFCLVPWLGISDFHTRGEAREALIVQSMFDTDNYILPRGYNHAIPSKPPLFHWLATLTSHIAGKINEFTIRLPSALFALSSLAIFLLLLRNFLNPKGKLIMLVLLSFSFEWLRASVSARVDMVHAASLSTGLLFIFFAAEYEQIGYWISIVLLLGLAILSKGPVAIALPILIITAWFIYNRETAGSFKSLFISYFAILLSLFIALIWYAMAYVDAPGEFSNRFWYENISRFTSTMEDQPHKHSAFYLIGMFLLGTLPWSPLIISLWIKQLKKSQLGLRQKWSSLSQLEKFCALSSAIIFIFYCIPSSKRGVYLLAAYPFLAILSAKLLERSGAISDSILTKTFALALIIVFAAQIIVVPRFVAPHTTERRLAEVLVSLPHEDAPLYSYGFEFYGASFYSKINFLRLEDFLNSSSPIELNSLSKSRIVLFASKHGDLKRALERSELLLETVETVQVGSKEVEIIWPKSKQSGGI